MRILAEQPVSIGKVLDISLKLYSASFKLFLPYCGLLTLFYIAIGFISQSLQHGSDVEKGLLLLLLGLMLLVMAVFFFILYAAMVYRVDNFIHERDDSMMDSLLFGLKKFFPVLWTGILYGLAVTFGMILLFIPGMIIGLSMSLYLNVIVVENKSGFAALKTSHSLVWGHWWRTLTVFMAPGLVFIILYAAILSAVLLFQYLGLNELDWLVSIIANLLSALIAPYFLGLGYVQYHDLTLRKTGADLAQRLAG